MKTKIQITPAMREKCYAEKGFNYCFVLTANGWRNTGMVPDTNRQPFTDEYKLTKGTRVAFVPFCWNDNPNVMTDSHIYSYAETSL